MVQKKLTLSIFLLFLIGICILQAQEVVTTSGGNASGTGGSVSYTLGQITYKTNTGSSGSVAQGVQQPYEISVVTGVEDADITLEMVVYPNPVTDVLRLKIGDTELQNFKYQLYDMNGSIYQDKKIESNETDIIMSNNTSGAYFLKITKGSKLVKIFKIIKN